VWEGTSPRWVGAPPTKAQGARESGRGQTLGLDGPKAHLVVRPPLSPLGRPPRWDLGMAATPRGGNLGGAQPLPSPYIYLRFELPTTHEFLSILAQPYPSLSPHISRCFAKPCWITTLLHHHHAVVLLLDGVFLNLSLPPCWIKA